MDDSVHFPYNMHHLVVFKKPFGMVEINFDSPPLSAVKNITRDGNYIEEC